MKCPCKDCIDKRKIGCHGFCEEYKAWNKWNEEQKEKRRKAMNSKDCRSTAYSKLVSKIKRRR